MQYCAGFGLCDHVKVSSLTDSAICGETGVICVETIGNIRRWHRVDKLSVSEIARRLSASRNTVGKYLEGELTEPRYKKASEARAGDGWMDGAAGSDADRLPVRFARRGPRDHRRLAGAL